MSAYAVTHLREIMLELNRDPDLQYRQVSKHFDVVEQVFENDLVDWEFGCDTYSSLMTALYAAKGCVYECETELGALLALVECYNDSESD